METRPLLRTLALGGASLMALGAWAFIAATPEGATTAAMRVAGSARASLSSSVAPSLYYESLSANASQLLASALAPSAAGADPLQVEPRVPRAAGSPCIVTLFRDVPVPVTSIFDPQFSYTPPAACPGPWAKVKLVVQLSGPRQNGLPTSAVSLSLTDPPILEGSRIGGAFWAGAPQITADIPTWTMERDVTEYASILKTPKVGFFSGSYDNDNFDFDEVLEVRGTALLLFYPATAATPAQRLADVVLPVAGFDPTAHEPSATLTQTFPRNIERVYLDVIAHVEGGGFRSGQTRYWYACAPDEIWEAFPYLNNGYAIGDARANTASLLQGCQGGGYREVEVRIDGRLAGLAPVFPWLGSAINNNFRNTVDVPAPSVQALNWMPYRVDLTPFAGVLNDGAPHTVQAQIVDADNGFLSSHLLLYLDKARAIVPGAVTRNTLAESTPTVTDTLVQTTNMVGSFVNHHLTGQVVTRSVRSYRIDGYVDTSRGRIASTVLQRNYFLNTNIYDVTSFEVVAPFEDYDADFGQKVRLTSSVDRTSRRTLGTTLLSEDKLYSTFPLVLDYRHAGGNRVDSDFAFAGTDFFNLDIHQARVLRTSQFRRGTARYTTSLTDIFDASRDYANPDLGTPAPGDSNWASARTYLFTDNRGSCYSAGLTTVSATLDTRTRGQACPGGSNGIRWFAHPDGSPDSLNWAPAP